MNRLGFFLLLFFASPAVSEVIPYSTFGSWDIDLYTGDDDVPTACRGYVRYNGSETSMLVGFAKSEEKDLFTLTILNDDWRSIERGKEYSLTIKFPNRSPWTLTTLGLADPDNDYFGVRLRNELNEKAWEFISDYRKSLNMKVDVEGNPIGGFKLKGTSGMLSEAWKCYQNKVVNAKKDPFSVGSKKSDPFDI